MVIEDWTQVVEARTVVLSRIESPLRVCPATGVSLRIDLDDPAVDPADWLLEAEIAFLFVDGTWDRSWTSLSLAALSRGYQPIFYSGLPSRGDRSEWPIRYKVAARILHGAPRIGMSVSEA